MSAILQPNPASCSVGGTESVELATPIILLVRAGLPLSSLLSDMARPEKNVITIYTELGIGDYGWLTPEKEINFSLLGINIARAIDGFDSCIPVSEELEKEFTEWDLDYERNSLHENFDWDTFNKKGLELSMRLKQELKNEFRVIYATQAELEYIPERMECNLDGTTRAFVPQRGSSEVIQRSSLVVSISACGRWPGFPGATVVLSLLIR